MSVSKPDATAFDSADDRVSDARAELHTLAVAFNTIADEYNAGTLGGGGGILQDTQINTVSGTGSQNPTATNGVTNWYTCTGSGATTVLVDVSSFDDNTVHYVVVQNSTPSYNVTVDFEYGANNIYGSDTITGTQLAMYKIVTIGNGSGTVVEVQSHGIQSALF